MNQSGTLVGTRFKKEIRGKDEVLREITVKFKSLSQYSEMDSLYENQEPTIKKSLEDNPWLNIGNELELTINLTDNTCILKNKKRELRRLWVEWEIVQEANELAESTHVRKRKYVNTASDKFASLKEAYRKKLRERDKAYKKRHKEKRNFFISDRPVVSERAKEIMSTHKNRRKVTELILEARKASLKP
jgi:hypothetical protein